ncbi:hypothetical protein BS17DRAFT_775505 [Gyrodon lividus]|nr:hypothetical protein BS17DRAFT_775505 [Gyrodon lividus]
MAQRFIVMFENVSTYEKYKNDVIAGGGTIVCDLGSSLMGFTAEITPTVLALMQAESLCGNGISNIEADSIVTTQK